MVMMERRGWGGREGREESEWGGVNFTSGVYEDSFSNLITSITKSYDYS